MRLLLLGIFIGDSLTFAIANLHKVYKLLENRIFKKTLIITVEVEHEKSSFVYLELQP